MHSGSEIVRIGVGVFVLRNDRVLLGRRMGAHGAGTWALPGGHLEFGESIEACATREVREETGLKIRGVRQAAFTNDVFHAENKHYVTLFVVAESNAGEPAVLEPEKCSGWEWFEWSELPRPLFAPLKTLVEQGFVPNPEIECSTATDTGGKNRVYMMAYSPPEAGLNLPPMRWREPG